MDAEDDLFRGYRGDNPVVSSLGYNSRHFMFTKIPTTLQDCYIIEPQVFSDSRGFFMETYSSIEFAKIGIDTVFMQDNHSKSKK